MKLVTIQPKIVDTKQEVIEVIRNNLDKFAELGVSEVGLFGSFVREENTKDSDVDLLVTLNANDKGSYYENYFRLLNFVDTLFQDRSVDVVTENSINENNGIYICKEVEYVTLHPQKVDGIRYLSRHDNSQLCWGLFDRDYRLEEQNLGNLIDHDELMLLSYLDRYEFGSD